MGGVNSGLGLEVSFHFKKRLVSRIHKVNLDDMSDREVGQYIDRRTTELTLEARHIFAQCTFVWQGTFTERHPCSNYYLYEPDGDEKFIVITDVAKTKLVTLYPVEYNFPSIIENFFVKKIISELRRTHDQWSTLRKRKAPRLQKKRERIAVVEKRVVEQNREIERLKREVQEGSAEFDQMHHKAEHLAYVLCMSYELQKEMFPRLR